MRQLHEVEERVHRVVRVKIVCLRNYLLVVHSPVSPLRVNGNKRYYIVAYQNIMWDACDGSVQFIVQQMGVSSLRSVE